ncbi:capsule-associated protein CAP1 [Moesziomyces antarcticus]|uniref:Related to capsule-associated protein-like protein n=2 Tax=Pseudozyma antarctica TaxID=84753 RepID=A0A5C3FUS8_PSEA2|nr:capsule-associated protein CAP1 [Moesziomyces antarcticus]GAK66964.1 capsule-associated protein CAP1 [Moesziomyces antarcticus]SPO48016.1 related to capsule-associated protein-like protein [Moesziomyces antarcticus]
MEKNSRITYDHEKGSPEPGSSSSSTSNYPPSPGYVADEYPAWARPAGSGTSLRQRVFDLFDNSVLGNKSRGYAPLAGSGQGLPHLNSSHGSGIQDLLRNSSHKRLLKIILLVLCLGVPLALFASTPVSNRITSVVSKEGQTTTAASASSQPQGIEDYLLKDSLKDAQCAGVLEGGADAIMCHINLAKRKYELLMSRQSKTYEQAVARYVQQNKRQPPPGFDDWFKFAQENNAVIIDEYDQLENDLLPLRKFSGYVLRRRMENALKTNTSFVHRWDFANGSVTTTAPSGWQNARVFREIMTPFLPKLPPFTLLHNWDDFPRVCGPKPGQEDVHSTEVTRTWTYGNPHAMDVIGYGCPRKTVTESVITSDRPSLDVCKEIDLLKTQHGIGNHPSLCFNSTIPALSLAKISGFLDITTASWCYGDPGYRLFGENKDTVAYADKKSHLYWRGSSTGSVTSKEKAYFGHRYRLVMMAHQLQLKAKQLAARAVKNASFTLDDQKRYPLPNMPGTFNEAQLGAISRLSAESFDLGFVRMHNCNNDPVFCKTWTDTIPLAKPEPSKTAFQNKFLMDLDGNSMSGRFYRFLDSNSLVFKQTVFAEWHDDRIVPWLHFVPVSRGMEELPILIDFFANHPEGKKLGEFIATESRKWSETTLRKIDLSVYTYRQMIELANIIGHD